MGSFNSISAAWITIALLVTGCGQITATNTEAEAERSMRTQRLATSDQYYRMTAQTSVNGQAYSIEVDHAKSISPTESMALANDATTFFANANEWWEEVGIVYIRIDDEALPNDFAQSALVESFDAYLCIPGFTVNASKVPLVTCALDPAHQPLADDEKIAED